MNFANALNGTNCLEEKAWTTKLTPADLCVTAGDTDHANGKMRAHTYH